MVRFIVDGCKFDVEHTEKSIDIVVIDIDMIKYRVYLDDIKAFKIPYVTSLDVVYDIIREALQSRTPPSTTITTEGHPLGVLEPVRESKFEQKTTLTVQKITDGLQMRIRHNAGFFVIPLDITIPVETETENIILERKIRKIEVDKNNELRVMRDVFTAQLQLLKTQLGNVIFLSTCNTPIPMDVTALVLRAVGDEKSRDYGDVLDHEVRWTNNTTNTDRVMHTLGITLENVNGCANCGSGTDTGAYCTCKPSQAGKHVLYVSTMIAQIFERHMVSRLQGAGIFFAPSGDALHCRFSGPNLHPIRLLRNLTSLTIHDNTNVTDIGPVAGLPLDELFLLNCTALKTVEPVARLHMLTRISLDGCSALSDGTPLEALEHLVQVTITKTKIRKLKLIAITAKVIK